MQAKRGLIAFDLDGTVYAERTDSLPSKRVSRAFAAAHDLGYELAVATGRPIFHLKEEFFNQPWLDWMICSSGASLYTPKQNDPIFRLSLSRELMLEACDVVGELAFRHWLDTPLGFMCETSFTENEHWPESDWAPFGAKKIESVYEIAEPSGGFQKLMFHFAEPKVRERAQAILTEAMEGRAEIANEGEYSLELSPLGATKANTARKLCEHAGLPIESSIAFGDSGNDTSFANTPFTFVVMESATDDVKALADDICPDVHKDGVAIWLEKHILI